MYIYYYFFRYRLLNPMLGLRLPPAPPLASPAQSLEAVRTAVPAVVGEAPCHS